MGISVDAYLVAGVRLSDLVQKVRESSSVTKYDPDTGKPYEKAVEVKKVKIGDTTHEQLDEYPEGLIKWPKGLEFLDSGDIGGRNNWDNTIVGVKVAEADERDPVKPVDKVVTRDAASKARMLLAKVGFKDEVHLYLIQYGSA